MLSLPENASIKLWYDFLVEECGLDIGRDWHWAWHDNRWAVEFSDLRNETAVRLKMADSIL